MGSKKLPASLKIHPERSRRVRPFRMADYEAVAELWHLGGLNIAERVQVRAWLRRDRDLFLVAEVQQRTVGVILGRWDGRHASVWKLAVAPDFRRRGIARALLEALEGALKAKGATGVFLLVWHENRQALRLYRSCGYASHKGVLFMHKSLLSQERAPARGRRKRTCCPQ